MRHRVLTLVLAVAAVACTSGDEAVIETTAAPTTVPTTVPTTGAAAPVGLTTGPSPFGEMLVDGDGMTLYFLVSDQQFEPTCVGACTGTWAPYPFDRVGSLGDSIDAALVGSIDHEDGITQTTYNGWPLYRFREDVEPGDMNGHAAFNAFFALGPNGGSVGVTE